MQVYRALHSVMLAEKGLLSPVSSLWMLLHVASPVVMGPTAPRHLENARERKKGLSRHSQQARRSDISCGNRQYALMHV